MKWNPLSMTHLFKSMGSKKKKHTWLSFTQDASSLPLQDNFERPDATHGENK